MKNDKIILYDSPEAGKLVTVTAYEVNNRNVKWYSLNEHSARYHNSTHKKCDCGEIINKYYTRCDSCLTKLRLERYSTLEFRKWDGKEVVCTIDGYKYFYSEDELIEYMMDNEMNEIDLLICNGHCLWPLSKDYWIDYYPKGLDTELDKEIQDAIDNLNSVISKAPPVNYSPSRIRTNYKL